MHSEHGRRLIPTLIDQVAEKDPGRIYCTFATSVDIGNGFTAVTYGQLANAINRTARWIQSTLGTSHSFETITYLGPPDLRYVFLTVAAQKTGFKVGFSCPK